MLAGGAGTSLEPTDGSPFQPGDSPYRRDTRPLPLLRHHSRIHHYPCTSFDTYIDLLATGDIGLMVLEPGIFTDAKSANRWMEFSFCGIPSIVSPTETLRELIEPSGWVVRPRNTAVDRGDRMVDRISQPKAVNHRQCDQESKKIKSSRCYSNPLAGICAMVCGSNQQTAQLFRHHGGSDGPSRVRSRGDPNSSAANTC